MSAIDIIRDWLLDPNTCFLLGAGCSKCAGLPTLLELTDKVRLVISKETQTILDNLNCANNKKPNIEDLISYLLREQTQLNSLKSSVSNNEKIQNIDKELRQIQISIHKNIGMNWRDSENHREFLQNLAMQKSRRVCNLFCLNWDTLLEASLEAMQIAYTDGFYGSENAFFKPELFDLDNNFDIYFKIYKLHGSINWIRDENEVVRRLPLKVINESSQRMVIYPAEQKYIQTQYGIYEKLLDCFKKYLREPVSNRKLVVIGYSYNDEHINLAIEDSIRAQESLSVYVLLGKEDNLEAQKQRLKTIAGKNNDRLNFLIGCEEFIGNGLSPEEKENIKQKELWKFESIVKILNGSIND